MKTIRRAALLLGILGSQAIVGQVNPTYPVLPDPSSPPGTLEGGPNDLFGKSIAIVADWNGDGVDDFAVGAPGGGGNAVFRIFSAVTGATIGTTGAPSTQAALGSSCAGAGAVFGPGTSAVLVGCPGHNTGAGAETGQVKIIANSGQQLAVNGIAVGDRFGDAVAGVGDLNGDGVPDFVVGAPQTGFTGNGKGYVEVISGAVGFPILATLFGSASGDHFGAAVAGVGDVTGDGLGEFLVGAPGATASAGAGAGQVTLFTYSTTLAACLPLKVFSGNAAHEELGAAVAAAGDVNGDGRNDLVIGGPGASKAYVYGSAAPYPLYQTLQGVLPTDRFGASVAGINDTNCDGVPEIIVGAPLANPSGSGAFGGEIRVFSVTTSTATEFYKLTESPVSGFTPDGPKLGLAVAGGAFVPNGRYGDLNGDGVGDVIYAAPDAGLPNQYSGYVRIISGTGVTPPATIKLGSACAGSGGFTPAIGTVGGSPSATVGNQQWGISLSNALGATDTILILGFGLSPFSLAPFGSPGCFVYPVLNLQITGNQTTGLVPGQGVARVLLPLPVSPSLVGSIAYFQWAVEDPTGLVPGVFEINPTTPPFPKPVTTQVMQVVVQ